jgi:hypothetical protein
MKPAYVTFEQAKKLKEKEFNVECNTVYVNDWSKESISKDTAIYEKLLANPKIAKGNLISTNLNDNYNSRPEHWQLVEWLRINHGIWVRVNSMDGINWFYDIWNFGKEPNTAFTKDAQITFSENENYDTPQEAHSAAFDYVLNNLI